MLAFNRSARASEKTKPLDTQYSLYQRLVQMMIGWGSVGVVYFAFGWRETQTLVLPKLWLDQYIAFNPQGIWLYLLFFILIPYCYITVAAKRLLALRYAMQVSAILSGIVFLMIPTTLDYPVIVGQGLSVEVLKFLVTNDSTQNCLPSLHAALSLICVIALWQSQQLMKSLFIAALGIAIGISIIQLRRHLSIDVGAGLIVGLLSCYLSSVLQRFHQYFRNILSHVVSNTVSRVSGREKD
jgi:membrane-associated phospholipid phosphatase